MKNCIQSNGEIEHCSQSHASIEMVKKSCDLESQSIIDLKCRNPSTGGSCMGAFSQGTSGAAGGTAESQCNACGAAKGSTETCSFDFSKTTTSEITTSWSNAVTAGMSIEFSVGVNIDFFSAGIKTTYSLSDTFTTGKSKSKSSSISIQGGCSATIEAGTQETATAQFITGTLKADFTGKLKSVYKCNIGKGHTETKTVTSTMTIQNVPTMAMNSDCKVTSTPCGSDKEDLVKRLQRAE